jgi:RNA-splicing ligase RtcB
MQEVAQLPVVTRVSLMPDACPAGPGVCVGGVVETKDAIIPAMHSADMCCSMNVTFFVPPPLMDVKTLMDKLQKVVRFGPGGRERNDQIDFRPFAPRWQPLLNGTNRFLNGLEPKAQADLGTCGDGNHFAFLGKMPCDERLLTRLNGLGHGLLATDIWAMRQPAVLALVTHFGSRGVGAEIFRRGSDCAARETSRIAKDIPSWGHWIPASSPAYAEYWKAVAFVEQWTRVNHAVIHEAFLDEVYSSRARYTTGFFNAHNFVWKWHDKVIHGKGATPAWKQQPDPVRKLAGTLGIIPLNMAQPILLVAGKDNDKFLSMAPHGAGRNLSRSALMRKVATDLVEGLQHMGHQDVVVTPEQSAAWNQKLLEDQTRGLDIRWYTGKPDLSETPMAYKDAATVRQQIEQFGLAEVWGEIEPLGCIMAGEVGQPWKNRKVRR